MAALTRVVHELRREQQRLEKELQRVNSALSALASLNGGRRGRPAGSRNVGRRRLSAAARRRIAAAQRARWAKVREAKAQK